MRKDKQRELGGSRKLGWACSPPQEAGFIPLLRPPDERLPGFMDTAAKDPAFLVEISPETVRREKERARELRRTQWWQRRLAKGVCHYCQRKVAPHELTMDHIVPVARGGRSTRGNVVPACKTCNNRKKYLLPVEWEEYLKRLTGSASSDVPGASSAEQGKAHDGMQRV